MAALQVQLLSVEYPCVTSSTAWCVLWVHYITMVSIYYNHGYSIPNTRRNCKEDDTFLDTSFRIRRWAGTGIIYHQGNYPTAPGSGGRRKSSRGGINVLVHLPLADETWH